MNKLGKVAVALAMAVSAGTALAEKTWYVATNGSDGNSGESETSAFKSLSVAVERAGEDDTIRVLAGNHADMAVIDATHALYRSYSCLAEVKKRVRIVGAGPEKTILRCRKDGRTYAAGIYLGDAGAVLEGVTVVEYNSDNTGDDRYGCGVYVTAGVVSNCSFTACAARNHRPALALSGADAKGYAIAVTNNAPLNNTKTYIACVDSGALLVDSEISRNVGGEKTFAALGIGGGIVRNCTIADNDAESNQEKYAGGVHVSSGGTLADSRILRNRLSWRNKGSQNTAGGCRVDEGLVTNCLFVANSDETMNPAGTSSGGLTLNGASARAVDCTLVGNKSFVCGPQFRVITGTAAGILVESDGTGNDFADATGQADVATSTAPGFRDRTDFELHPLSDWTAYGWRRPSAPAGASLLALPEQGICRVGSDVVVEARLANAEAGGYAWTVTCGETVTHPAAGAVLTLEHPEAGNYIVQVEAAGLTSSAEVKVMPTTCYVSATGGAGVFPYDRPERATSSVQAAIDAVYPDAENPSTVEVAAGTYDETAKKIFLNTSCRHVFVLKPVRIVGEDRETTHFDFATWSSLLLGGFHLAHPQATLSGVRISNCLSGKDGWQENASALDVIAGCATNVSVSGSKIMATHTGPLVVVRANGVLEDSFVGDNAVVYKVGYSGWGRNVMGVYVNGGTVRRTAVCRNIPAAGCTDKFSVIGMRVTGATAHVSDCLIEGNLYNGGTRADTITAAGLYQENGLVERCIVQCNTNALTTAAAKSAGGVYFGGGTLRNCLIAGNLITSSAADSAGGLYVNAASGEASHLTVTKNASQTASALGGAILRGTVLKASLVSGNAGNTQMSVVSGAPQYCCYPEASAAVGTGNDSKAVVFAGAQALPTDFASVGDFAITRASGGFELVPEQYATDDLAGAARPLVAEGGRPSAGALEPAVISKFTAYMTASAPSYAAGETAVFTLALEGADTTIRVARWTVVSGNVTNEYETTVGTLELTLASGSYAVAAVVENNSGETAETALPEPVQAYPHVTYVSTDGSDTWPYDTEAKAARSFYTAIDAAYGTAEDPAVVHVAPGVYRDVAQKSVGALTYVGVIDKPVRVVGDAGRERTVVVLQGDSDPGNGFFVNHEAAVFEGVTLTGSYGTSGSAEDWTTYGGALTIEAGTVRACAVTGMLSRAVHTLPPVRIAGGRMENCRIFGNRHIRTASMSGFGRSAMGIYNRGGMVADCEISGNGRPGGENMDKQDAGGLYQTAGVTSNCTIRANLSCYQNAETSYLTAAGAKVTGGSLLNCAIMANTNSAPKDTSAAAGLVVDGAATVVRNCLVAGNVYDSTQAGAAAVRMNAGTMDNVTVCDNDIQTEGATCAGLRLTGGAVCNTVVWGNLPAAGADVVRTAGTMTYCCYPEAAEGVDGNTAGDPMFRGGAKRGKGIISSRGSCFRTGSVLGWMDGATDLLGNPRTTLVGDEPKVNIGCYQVGFDRGLMLLVK